MQKGDLGNELVPRIALVFEHLVGIVPSPFANIGFSSFIRTKRWHRAVEYLVVNEPLAKQMWHVTWHLNHQLEVVTYWDEKAVKPIEKWIDKHDLPIHRVWYSDPDKLARRIAVMPDLAAIYDPDPKHQLRFGRKGHIVNPASPNLIDSWS